MKRLICVLVCLFSFVFSIPASSLSFEATELYFTSQPKLAYAKEDLLFYADESLLKAKGLIKKNQDLTLQAFFYNPQGLPVFQLKNGGFILASQKHIAEDKILEKSAVKGTYYLKKGASFYASPPLSDTLQKATSYQPYQQVTVTEKAVTRQGTYLRLMDGTWVAEG